MDLRIEFEWDDPRGARGPELRATWARLEIRASSHAGTGEPVTLVYDRRTRSVRSGVHVPLYPLAEWLAANWWFLAYEANVPGSMHQRTYRARHSLCSARDGYALPNLTIEPQGASVQLRWERAQPRGCTVEFLSSGVVVGPAHQVVEELRRFVDAVCARLSDMGVTGTWLQNEWDAIRDASPDEEEFCASAAAMGLDPYSLDEGASDRIIAAVGGLPADLRADFVSLADVALIGAQREALDRAIAAVRSQSGGVGGLPRFPRASANTEARTPPFMAGYEAAKWLRGAVGLNGDPLPTWQSLAAALGASEAGLLDAILPRPEHSVPYDGLAGANQSGGASFIVGKAHDPSRRYTFCRCLHEYLASPDGGSLALVTTSHAGRHQRSRAFAAEFLAPAEAVAARLGSGAVSEEQVSDLAQEFGVSEFVICHQIENHRLAPLMASPVG